MNVKSKIIKSGGFNKLKFIILIVLAIISLGLFILPIILGMDAQAFKHILDSYSVPEVIFVAWMILATSTTLPISVAIFAGVLYFSFAKAMLLTCIGIFIGAIGTYYVSKFLGEGFIAEDYNIKSKSKIHLFNELLHEHSLAYVVLLKFVYIFPSNLAFLIAGVTSLSVWIFIPLVILGNLCTAFAVGGIILGVLEGNVGYILGSSALLLLINIIPIVIYYKEMKKLVLLIFSRKAYERFIAFEKAERKLKEKVIKAEKVLERAEKNIKKGLK